MGVLQTQSIILSDNQLKEELGLENYSSINTNDQLEGITVINGPSPAFTTLGMHFLSNDFRFQIAYRNTFGTLSSIAMVSVFILIALRFCILLFMSDGSYHQTYVPSYSHKIL